MSAPTQVEFEMPCPGCGTLLASIAVPGEVVTHHCPACECDYDVTVSKPTKADA